MRALFIALGFIGLFASPSLAWKPTTHNYFAEIAVDDALDGNNVTIEIIGGAPKVYKVRAAVIADLAGFREYYRAGVLGPDAYPDIATGQQSIHPIGDPWLKHIWENFGTTPQERAFRLGFLTHAAGDMYAHSFINVFSGGPFTFTPEDNATKHFVAESYVDKRLPQGALDEDFFKVSIKGLEPKIYSTMIDARTGSPLDTTLLQKQEELAGFPAGSFSIPRVFSDIRNGLLVDVKSNKAEIAAIDAILAAECSGGSLLCKPLDRATKKTYELTNQYMVLWIADINNGLGKLPELSHQMAIDLFYNSDRNTRIAEAEARAKDYAQNHILTMAGFPDEAGLIVGGVRTIIDKVVPKLIRAKLDALQNKLLDTMLFQASGRTRQEWEEYLTSPQVVFDRVMNVDKIVAGSSSPPSGGMKVSLKTFNQDYLKLADDGYTDPDEAFDYRKVPAAYNTVMMSKLILLSPKSINALIKSLGGKASLKEDNIMLGFMPSLDFSWQWRVGMVLAQDCVVYDQLFMPLPGKGGCK